MTLHKSKYLISIIVCVLIVASAVAFTRSNKTVPPPEENQEKQQTIDTLPLVISQVKDLEVINASLKNPGTENTVAVLEIKNKSKKAVIAVSVEIGEPEEADGVTVSRFKEGEEAPDIVIKPNDTIRIELSLKNAKLGEPIRVSGAIYADDSEDGEKTALETIHSQREHQKNKKSKGKSSPQ